MPLLLRQCLNWCIVCLWYLALNAVVVKSDESISVKVNHMGVIEWVKSKSFKKESITKLCVYRLISIVLFSLICAFILSGVHEMDRDT